MTGKHAIPVRRELRGKRGTNIDIARRLLADLRDGVAEFLRTGRTHAIDLRHVPHMTERTYAYFREALGTGEVTANITGEFRVEIAETAIAGVWWVAHRDADGNTITEILEITACPGILRVHIADVEQGLQRLNFLLDEGQPSGESEKVDPSFEPGEETRSAGEQQAAGETR
jgi:hydrogenase-1 operon protein HyaF